MLKRKDAMLLCWKVLEQVETVKDLHVDLCDLWESRKQSDEKQRELQSKKSWRGSKQKDSTKKLTRVLSDKKSM